MSNFVEVKGDATDASDVESAIPGTRGMWKLLIFSFQIQGKSIKSCKCNERTSYCLFEFRLECRDHGKPIANGKNNGIVQEMICLISMPLMID